jgi:hypothetical protein
MVQILIHNQLNSSCFQEFLCIGWKSAGLEKVKYDIIESLHLRNKEESQRKKRRDDIDRNQKLADSIWNYVREG